MVDLVYFHHYNRKMIQGEIAGEPSVWFAEVSMSHLDAFGISEYSLHMSSPFSLTSILTWSEVGYPRQRMI